MYWAFRRTGQVRVINIKYKYIYINNSYGEEDIKVYQSIFKPLEWNFLESHDAEICFAKVIVYEVNRRVVGLHYLGPNAGEVT